MESRGADEFHAPTRATHFAFDVAFKSCHQHRAVWWGRGGSAAGTRPVPCCLFRQLSSCGALRAVRTAWQWAAQAEEGQGPSVSHRWPPWGRSDFSTEGLPPPPRPAPSHLLGFNSRKAQGPSLLRPDDKAWEVTTFLNAVALRGPQSAGSPGAARRNPPAPVRWAGPPGEALLYPEPE